MTNARRYLTNIEKYPGIAAQVAQAAKESGQKVFYQDWPFSHPKINSNCGAIYTTEEAGYYLGISNLSPFWHAFDRLRAERQKHA